jgi:3',5'-cyclic-AMP phosphodiesterase
MRPVHVVQLTDPHLFGDETETLRGVATARSLERTLAAAAPAIAKADVVLVTGDLVQDDIEGYRQFRRIMGSLGKPIWCIPGNHDDAAALRSALAQPPFRVGGHDDLGAWRVVMLDSSVPNEAGGTLSPASLRELDTALAGAEGRPALVCLHHHPVPLHSRWLDEVGLSNGAEFFTVIDRYPNVKAVAWGHVHQEFDGKRGLVRLLATPSTCTQFLPGSAEFAVDTLPPAYRELMLYADGRLDTRLCFLP